MDQTMRYYDSEESSRELVEELNDLKVKQLPDTRGEFTVLVKANPVDQAVANGQQRLEDLYDLCQKFIDQEGIEEGLDQLGIAMQLGTEEKSHVAVLVRDIAKIVGYASPYQRPAPKMPTPTFDPIPFADALMSYVRPTNEQTNWGCE